MSLQQEFNKKGFVVIKSFFSKDEINELFEEIKSTSQTHASIESLNVGNLTFNSKLMHKSQKIREIISQPKVVNLVSQFLGPDFWVRWDQAVEKGPGATTFPWHTDNSYSQLVDPHCQFWIALTEMTKENGGIWMLPGSHKQKSSHEYDGRHMIYSGNTDRAEFVSAEIGDVVVFSSFTLHSTTPNITEKSRWAYVVEYMNIKHIDPYMVKPLLIVAKEGKPHLEYVESLPGEGSLYNKLKYLKPRAKWRQFKKDLLSKGV